jgi:hypothetical protein
VSDAAPRPTTPSEMLRTYHGMRPPQNSAEAMTAAELLGFDRDAVARIGREWDMPNGRREADEFEVDDEAPLPVPTRLLDLPPTPPRDFAIEGLVVKDEVNAIVGDGDAGKTSLVLACAGAVAAGAPALGELIVRPGPVLFVSGEDPADLIRNRLEALAAGHRWDLSAVLTNFHVYDEGVDLDDLRWQQRLMDAARDVKAVMASFDPVVDLCGQGVEENSNSDAKRVTGYLRTFLRRTGATPLLVMHVSKPSEGRTDRKHRVRGASAWKNACRMVWWAEACDGGIELDPIKANRLARPQRLRIKRTVTSDPDHPLMWQAAHLALDHEGTVVHGAVIQILRYVAGCAQPPSGREAADGDHGLPRDKVWESLNQAHSKGWLETSPGPNRSKLWSITEAGRARLMLDG